METTLRAVNVGRSRRRPKTYSGDRVCAAEACSTRLSRYNKSTSCYSHAPVKFPRLRGEFTEEFQAVR